MNAADQPKTEVQTAELHQGGPPRQWLRPVLWRAILAFLAAATLTLMAAHWIELKYTGTTKFRLRSDSAAKSSQSPSNESLDAIKLTLAYDLLDENAMEKVIKDLGLDNGMPHNAQGELTLEGKQAQQALVAALRRQAQLSWEVKSPVLDLLSLSVTSDDPKLAQQIPNELVKNYIEKSSAQITQRLTDSNSFLASQVNSCSVRLSELKNQRVAFETQHADMMPESPGIMQKRIDDLDMEVRKLVRERLVTQDKLRVATAKVVRLNELFPRAADSLSTQDANQLKIVVAGYRESRLTSRPATEPAYAAAPQPASPPAEEELIEITKVPNPERTRLEGQLRDLERTLVAERDKTDAQSNVQTLEAEIAQLKKEIEDIPAKVVTREVYRVRASRIDAPADPQGVAKMEDALRELNLAAIDYRFIDEDLAEKKASRDKMAALMANFRPIRQQWEELNKKVAECQAELNVWQGRRNDVQITLAAEAAKKRTHMETVEAAQEQFLPESPKLSMILGGAFLTGLGGAVVVLLLSIIVRIIPILSRAKRRPHLPVDCVTDETASAGQHRTSRIMQWLFSRAYLVVMLLCLAIAAMSITLKLQFPDIYPQWKSDPLAFLYNNGLSMVEKIIETIKAL